MATIARALTAWIVVMPRRGLLWPPDHAPENHRGRTPQRHSGLQLLGRCPEIPINHFPDRQGDRENADQSAPGMALFSLEGEVTRNTPRSSRRKAALMPRAGLTASAVTVLSVLAMAVLTTVSGLAVIVGPSTASAEGTHGAGMAYSDRTFQTFTASNGLSSKYHVYAAGVPQDHAAGVVLQFHGDGAYEFANPTSSYSLGGPSGIVAQSRSRGYITVPVRTPDTTGEITWWENGNANADFVADLLEKLKADYDIDTHDIWLVGYSGGAQFITQFFLPKYSHTLSGGGTVVFGGGGTPRVPVQPFAGSLIANLPLHWYTGGADNGTTVSDGYNALLDAQKGSAWYAAQGFTVDLESPPGLGHNLSGRFGTALARHLDDHPAIPQNPTATTTAATTPSATTNPATATTTAAPPAATTTVPATPIATTPPPQPVWNHTVTPTRIGAQLALTIPSGTRRTTFRVTATQGPFYVYNYTTSTGPRTLSIVSSLTPNTPYNYTLEVDDAIVGSGSFRTLP